MADAGRHHELLLERPVRVLAQDGHLRTVHLLAGFASRAVTARHDRIEDHLVAWSDVGDTLTYGIDDAGAVRAENGR